MTDRPREAPRYLRFARALALLSISAAAASGCEVVRNAIGCEHCHCGPAASFRQPVSCDVVDPSCCVPVEGPLSPPDLPA